MGQTAALFAQWEKPMVRACLQGRMGRVVPWGEASALATIGDFCFLAGEPDRELLERADRPILVPGSQGWSRLIEEVLGERAAPFTRCATRRRAETDADRLKSFTETLPQGFSIRRIDKEIYFTLMGESWSKDLCGNFADAEDFLVQGLGFAVLREGRPVAGAASYAVCDGGVEIEIDTRPDFRRRGLAKACGAQLILECLDRGLYPGWDAHDSRSLSLAEQLGYQLDHPYTAYWVEKRIP